MDYDFSFFLVIASLVTGVVWGAYCLYLKSAGQPYLIEKEPLLVEYARSFFSGSVGGFGVTVVFG